MRIEHHWFDYECDECEKEIKIENIGELLKNGWSIMTSDRPHALHFCSKECIRKYYRKAPELDLSTFLMAQTMQRMKMGDHKKSEMLEKNISTIYIIEYEDQPLVDYAAGFFLDKEKAQTYIINAEKKGSSKRYVRTLSFHE